MKLTLYLILLTGIFAGFQTKPKVLKNDKGHYLGVNEPLLMKLPKDSITFEESDDNLQGNSDCVKEGNPCTGSIFNGIDRKEAKTSIYTGETLTFNTIDELVAYINSNCPDNNMKQHDPTITESCSMQRVLEERKNVIVRGAYIYGIYREKDNDFHMIVGNGKTGNNMKLFNMEVSGLPNSNSPSYIQLKNVRQQISEKFGDLSCEDNSYKTASLSYPITIEGSLFFDVDHPAGKVGFTYNGVSYHPKTAWEIHPVTHINFN